jgi:hypothetical protein
MFGAQLQRVSATAAAQGPMFAQAEYMKVLQSMPEEIRSQMPRTYSPEWVERSLEALTKTPQHRGAMAVGRQQADAQIAVGTGHDAASRYGADARERASNYAAEMRQFVQNNKQNFQQFLTEYAAKQANGTATERDHQMAKMIEQMMYQYRLAGTPEDPRQLPREVLGGQGVGGQPVPRPLPPSAIPKPAAVPQPVSQQEVEAVPGWKYEPNIYDYRKGPTGLQRKRKMNVK